MRFRSIRTLPILCVWMSMAGVGCASSYPKVDLTRENFTNVPARIELNVPFVEQTPELCGPTALYMVGKTLVPTLQLEAVKKLSFTPKAKGSFPQDMVSATRRLHLQPYLVRSTTEIIDRLAMGSPIIIFHRTGFLWKDFWHYSVLTGYDLKSEKLVMHIGPYENRYADLSQVIGSWNEGGKWAFLIARGTDLPPGVLLQDALDNALAFLRLGYTDDALFLSNEMLKRWPERYEADVIKAQALLQNHQKSEAIAELKIGLKKEPQNERLKEKILEFSRSEKADSME